MGKSSEVGCSVEQLTDTGPSADPVSGCQSVHDLARQYIGSQAGGDLQLTLAVVVALELVLEVPSELTG